MRKILLMVSAFICLLPGHARAEFKNETGAGLLLTSGNTKTQSYHAKTVATYLFGKNSIRFDGNYVQAKQSGELSAKAWMLALRYERELSEKVSAFFAQSVEGDKFAGVLQRYNSDIGAKYFLYKSEKDFIWFGEGGYRYTRERGTNGIRESFQKARVYSEAETYWTESTSTKAWAEYIPNFTESKGWLLNGELSLSTVMNSVMSLKTAYLVKYNNEPPVASAKKTDRIFSTSLVAKF